MERNWDVVVIGAGPAGLSAALMLGRSRRRVVVLDARNPRNRFASHMHGVLGNEGTSPGDLSRRGRAEVTQYGVEFADTSVITISDAGDQLHVIAADGSTHRAREVIVASGITDEVPDVPGLARWWGNNLLSCPYCEGWEVRDRHLGALLTSPFGMHQVQLVRQLTERVTVFAAIPLEPAMTERLRSRDIEVVTEPIAEVVDDGERLTGVRLADGATVNVDALFTTAVPHPNDDFLDGLDLDRTASPFGTGSFLTVDPAGKTSNPRLWAVGNVANPAMNVPMSIGAGAMTGGAVNAALADEDFDHAVAAKDSQT